MARVPDELTAAEAAPLMCAGTTTLNALVGREARPGDLVAVLGLGGLGHLATQFAVKLGFRTAVIGRGKDDEPLARTLGAHHYIDNAEEDPAAALSGMGGASLIVATAPNADAMSATIDGLAPRGQLVLVGATPDPLKVNPLQLIGGSRTVVGHSAGTARDAERTMAFAAVTGVRPMVETVAMEDIGAAFERMLGGAARFRMVLVTGNHSSAV
ncbi:zinc-binding dehydrogenase [Streptomyces sp. NPDC048479]|uniref:zinc-binding dehydrogenase n=1 Tax=Streptomyces sp. NPDC048479 TaxID=3154725 RepID=UPI00341A6B04